MGTLAARWTLVEPEWLGTASGVRADSMNWPDVHVQMATREWSPSHGSGNRSAVLKGETERYEGDWC